jgi:aspartate carbamoyltransferase catalytic subunit
VWQFAGEVSAPEGGRGALENWLQSRPHMSTDTSAAVQRDAHGRLRHLITLEGLRREEITALLDLAQFYVREPGDLPARDQSLAGHTVANLFFEPSTRTRVSFELAAQRLGADVVNLDMQSSSRVKGETVLDTIYTLQAMHADVLVMRDAEPGLPAHVARFVAPHVSVLNAGEAHLSHPTQGLLDALTVRQMKGDLSKLKILICGDISHSRVARSAWQVFSTLGVEQLRIAAPEDLMPGEHEFAGAVRYGDVDSALSGVDVVMALRIQRERMQATRIPDEVSYHHAFGITAERLALAKPDAIVMHPGPMNRDVEISSGVADGPQSVIQRQVANGVAVRMAVLATITRNVQARRHFR